MLEGLDRTGKTTQRDRLASRPWVDAGPSVCHLPSGLVDLTRAVYRLTEDHRVASPLGRQLLHLACHAETMPALHTARYHSGLVLDRWWWSTVAYGWYGGALASCGVDRGAFFSLIDAVWSAEPPDLVLLFLNPYVNDDKNRKSVLEGYEALAAEHADRR